MTTHTQTSDAHTHTIGAKRAIIHIKWCSRMGSRRDGMGRVCSFFAISIHNILIHIIIMGFIDEWWKRTNFHSFILFASAAAYALIRSLVLQCEVRLAQTVNTFMWMKQNESVCACVRKPMTFGDADELAGTACVCVFNRPPQPNITNNEIQIVDDWTSRWIRFILINFGNHKKG